MAQHWWVKIERIRIKRQTVIGGRWGPSPRSGGSVCAHPASHGDGVNHHSAPHTGTHLVHLASSKHFCMSSWDSCQLADRNQRARWPNAAPGAAQVCCSNLSGAPELKVAMDCCEFCQGKELAPQTGGRACCCGLFFSI